MANKVIKISKDQNEVILKRFTAVFKASERPTNCGGVPCTAHARRDKQTGIFIRKDK